MSVELDRTVEQKKPLTAAISQASPLTAPHQTPLTLLPL